MGPEKKELLKIIGKNIRAAREQKKMKQVELAEILGCSSYYISHLENGRATIPLETLLKLTKILESDINSFLVGTGYESEEYLIKDIVIKGLNDLDPHFLNMLKSMVDDLLKYQNIKDYDKKYVNN